MNRYLRLSCGSGRDVAGRMRRLRVSRGPDYGGYPDGIPVVAIRTRLSTARLSADRAIHNRAHRPGYPGHGLRAGGALRVQRQPHAALRHGYARRRLPQPSACPTPRDPGTELGLRQPAACGSPADAARNSPRAAGAVPPRSGGGYGGSGQRRPVRIPGRPFAPLQRSRSGGVQLIRTLSDSACVQGRTWGWDRSGVWVDRGCRAEFSVY